MKYIILAAISTMLFFFAAPKPTAALSPAPAVFECWEEKKSGKLSDACEKTLCEWDNIEKNWPNDTGYYRNCSQLGSQNQTTIAVVSLAVITLGAILWYFRKRKKV